MSDNWIVQNLNSALNTWNEKLAEIWTLLTQSPESFKGGTIWSVITGINGALTAIGYGLLVLFFAAGIVKTCGSFTDMKKPEHALKAFIRFALAQGAIMYGMELMTALFSIVQGIVSTIMAQSGMANGGVTELPAEIVEKIEAVGMLESIPLWIVTLLGSLLITVLSFIMILTVYGSIYKLYMYTAISPIPISTFAGALVDRDAAGKPFDHSAVFYHDPYGIWKNVEAVYVYCHGAHPHFHLCGRTLPGGGEELHQVLCRGVSGRGDHCTVLYNFLRLFCQSASNWGYVLKCCDHCVELCRGIGVQPAGAGGCGESI